MLKKMFKGIVDKLDKKLDEIEYAEMRRVFKNYAIKNNKPLIVDVGSGLSDAAEFFSNLYPLALITCVDINDTLVDLALEKGFEAVNANITQIPYSDDTFDIVHCSHVIEHLGYPDVVHALDELIRITKKNGIIIIRSPLLINHRFYNDIDHVRPYPPNAVLNYFNYQKQQKVSNYSIIEIDRWYTRIYCEINYYKYPGVFAKYLNLILKTAWTFTGFPAASPNNYGIVLKKA